jgi:hypothetical protein
MAATLAELLEGLLEFGNAPRAERTQTADSVGALLRSEGVFVAARGRLVNTQKPATLSDLARQRLGWVVFGVEGEVGQYKNFLNNIGRSIENKTFRQTLQDRVMIAARELPTAKVRPAKQLGPQASELELTLPSALLERSAGGSERQRLPSGNGLVVFVTMVPDAGRVWFAVSPDRQMLQAQLMTLRTGKGPTLSERQGLGELKTVRATGAGFLSLQALADLAELGDIREAGELGRALLAAPHHGQTPILVFAGAEARQQPGNVISLRVPKQVLQDAGSAGLALGMR